MRTPRLLLACAIAAAAFAPATASASKSQESTFQDDPLLVGLDTTAESVKSTLDTLQRLGVDRIRISAFWDRIAPNATDVNRPNLDTTDPAAYPAANWERYDRVIRGAIERGMTVNINPTSPAPRWATQTSPRADLQKNYGPDPIQFGQFVQALGTRYSGTYKGLPRVDYWSIWNEPNQGAWLSPQWRPDPRNAKKFIEASPHLYRNLVQTAWAGLANSGHGTDTILIGETAPKGVSKKGISRQMSPLRFLRQVYCLDDNLQLLKGTSASNRNCPTDGSTGAFVAANPGLFRSTGYAHHPYELLLSPTTRPDNDDDVTVANLNSMQGELKRIYARYAQKTQTSLGVPLYLTEFGYQTPPDKLGVSFSKQAAYINQSEFIAYNNRLVQTMSQFLLNDDGPLEAFQSGLRSVDGKDKTSIKAYMTPIFISNPTFSRGKAVRVWGGLRPATGTAPRTVEIQFKARGKGKKWRTLVTRTAKAPRFYVDEKVKAPGSGAIRLQWNNSGTPTVSRSVTVRRR